MKQLSQMDAFAAYESVRPRLPSASEGRPLPERIAGIADIAERFDVFLLDAFGVLNVGETPVPGAPECVKALQAKGKQVFVVSNAASVPSEELCSKYARLGYSFEPSDIITSRMVAVTELMPSSDQLWGVMGLDEETMDDFSGLNWVHLNDTHEIYEEVDAILLVGSGVWTSNRQELLESTLLDRPRIVCVANPDIVAPRESGFSTEPGFFAHQLADRTETEPRFFGKPFANIFDLVFSRLGPVDRSRIVMVGDSLHTDILGAQAVGIASVLIAGYGFFAGHDAIGAIQESGIRPDFIADGP